MQFGTGQMVQNIPQSNGQLTRRQEDEATDYGKAISQLGDRMKTMSSYERWSKRATRLRTKIANDSFGNYDDRDNLLAEVDSLIEEAKSHWS